MRQMQTFNSLTKASLTSCVQRKMIKQTFMYVLFETKNVIQSNNNTSNTPISKKAHVNLSHGTHIM